MLTVDRMIAGRAEFAVSTAPGIVQPGALADLVDPTASEIRVIGAPDDASFALVPAYAAAVPDLRMCDCRKDRAQRRILAAIGSTNRCNRAELLLVTRPDPLPDSPASAIRLARLTPWKARNELERWACLPLARLLFLWSSIPWGRNWRFYGLPLIQKHRASQITIADDLELRSTVRSNPLGPTHAVVISTRRAGARLTIGSGFGMTGGTLCADESITIGDRVKVGANSTVIDTDFHPLDAVARQRDPMDSETAPVVIEDDVFIGMNCLVLKGVRIGARSVIGAGSVVTHDIPADAIAAGNPARIVRDPPRAVPRG